MLNAASNKIQDEMTQNQQNQYIQGVGQFLLGHLATHPEDAEKIMDQDKTIGKSLSEMERVARTKKSGNCAVLSDAEGFTVVLKYFGIESALIIGVDYGKGELVSAITPQKPAVGFDVNLDELLKG